MLPIRSVLCLERGLYVLRLSYGWATYGLPGFAFYGLGVFGLQSDGWHYVELLFGGLSVSISSLRGSRRVLGCTERLLNRCYLSAYFIFCKKNPLP